MLQVIPFANLKVASLVWQFEGYKFDNTHTAFIIVEAAPGEGPGFHSHPYKEVFIVLEGTASFTVGKKQIEVAGGSIVIVPSDTPHKFINSGEIKLKQVGIHLNERIITNWLE